MLTGDLLRVRIDKKDLHPSFIDPSNPRLLDRAGQLTEALRQGLDEGWTRGAVEEALGEVEGLETDIKLTRGLAKVLLDQAEFAVQSPLDPPSLRTRVYARAAATGPLHRHREGPGPRRTAGDVLGEIAAELGCTVEEVQRGLYADLKSEQVLIAAEVPGPEDLLHRYNLGLAQAVLLRASSLTVRLSDPEPKRIRQIYRVLKFHSLMYRLFWDGDDLLLEVDGPLSLLQQSTRYGLQLAVFFPYVVLHGSKWSLEAEIRWGKRGLRKRLLLSEASGLRSFSPDTGTWRSRAEQHFEERFRALESGWEIGPGEPIDLGRQTLLVPDFSFHKGGRTAHLDIVGYWRKTYLSQRQRETPPNVVLAVSRKLAGEAKAALPDRVISFAELIPAKDVLERLEAVATPRA